MNLLLLGGTGFLGRAVATHARDRGVTVTALARGSAPVPEGVELVRADRDRPDALVALHGRTWDAVVDVSSQPGHVRRAMREITTRHVVYISSVPSLPRSSAPGSSAAPVTSRAAAGTTCGAALIPLARTCSCHPTSPLPARSSTSTTSPPSSWRARSTEPRASSTRPDRPPRSEICSRRVGRWSVTPHPPSARCRGRSLNAMGSGSGWARGPCHCGSPIPSGATSAHSTPHAHAPTGCAHARSRRRCARTLGYEEQRTEPRGAGLTDVEESALRGALNR